jgi:hypothetical protein
VSVIPNPSSITFNGIIGTDTSSVTSPVLSGVLEVIVTYIGASSTVMTTISIADEPTSRLLDGIRSVRYLVLAELKFVHPL